MGEAGLGNDVVVHSTQLTAAERRSVARLRREIRSRGWGLVGGCIEYAGRHVEVRYTAGLTRHHGHPEFVVCGAEKPDERALLAALAEHVAGGGVLEPSWIDFGDRTYALVDVHDSELLWLAHLVYGREAHRLRALQIVAPDRQGRWPWQQGAHAQPLLGDWPFD